MRETTYTIGDWAGKTFGPAGSEFRIADSAS